MNKTEALEHRAMRLAIAGDRAYYANDAHSARYLARTARRLDRTARRTRADSQRAAARRAARTPA